MVSQRKVEKVRNSRQAATGVAHIYAGFNNVIITITDIFGNALSSSSSGRVGFKGGKRGTPYAAHTASEFAAKKAKMSHGMKTVSVVIKGPGNGRESAIRALHDAGLIITSIRDVTPLPHNGCRPKKRRKV